MQPAASCRTVAFRRQPSGSAWNATRALLMLRSVRHKSARSPLRRGLTRVLRHGPSEPRSHVRLPHRRRVHHARSVHQPAAPVPGRRVQLRRRAPRLRMRRPPRQRRLARIRRLARREHNRLPKRRSRVRRRAVGSAATRVTQPTLRPQPTRPTPRLSDSRMGTSGRRPKHQSRELTDEPALRSRLLRTRLPPR